MQEQSQANGEPPSTLNKAWRKPLPEAEKQTELVGLRFTKTELEAIKKQAGLVPVATYLKHQIKTQNLTVDNNTH
jgi:hypothetical protein